MPIKCTRDLPLNMFSNKSASNIKFYLIQKCLIFMPNIINLIYFFKKDFSSDEVQQTSQEKHCSRDSGKNLDDLNSLDDVDFQLYGEPPPSYNIAKYYPKAPICQINQNANENIYENIDELNGENKIKHKKVVKHQSCQYTSARNSPRANASAKRTKFQGLKKNSLSPSLSPNSSNQLSATKAFKSQSQNGPTLNRMSYQNVTIKKQRSSSPTTLSTSSGSTSSHKNEQKNMNLIKNSNYDSLLRFKQSGSSSEQFL